MKFVLVKKQILFKITVALFILAATLITTNHTGVASLWQGRSMQKRPICSVDINEKKVALSFDATFDAENIPIVLSIMAEQDICATFFAVGYWADNYPDQLKELADSGYFEIGTHSNTHPDMAKLKKSQIELELKTSVEKIKSVAGKDITLFRAPFDSYNNAVLSVAKQLGLYTISHDIDSLDYKTDKASEFAGKILDSVSPGSIILIRNDGVNTVGALPVIIAGLKNKGYTFVPVGELIYKDNYTIDNTGKQIRSK